MPRQKGRKVPPSAPKSRVNHDYPPGWRRNDWVVPFIGGGACIHHGHDTDPDDHSLCGPSIFCCRKAAARYMMLFPEGSEAHANWELIDADHLLGWVANGVNVFYFIFCDPDRPDGLLALGLSHKVLPDILRRRVSLDTHAAAADRLL